GAGELIDMLRAAAAVSSVLGRGQTAARQGDHMLPGAARGDAEVFPDRFGIGMAGPLEQDENLAPGFRQAREGGCQRCGGHATRHPSPPGRPLSRSVVCGHADITSIVDSVMKDIKNRQYLLYSQSSRK